MEKETIKKSDAITIRFNALVSPKVAFNKESGCFEPISAKSNFRANLSKLILEKGDSDEETINLQRLGTANLMRHRMLSLDEALNIMDGDINNPEACKFYYKDEIVTLPKSEAEYYLNSFCGGEVTIRNAEKVLEKTHHMRNIDDSARYYEKSEMSRFKREHEPVMVAEIYRG